MPIISISTYSGRTQREKDRLAEAITEDVKKIFNVDKKDGCVENIINIISLVSLCIL
jgi:phenylpyruvate tautomerase PptA (4-oxalocrotonate tautomerase family)